MTDSVVVLKDDKDIKEAYKRATSGNLSRSKIDVWSNRPSLELPQCTLDTIVRHQAETNRKLGKVLELLESQPLQEISGLSDYLRQLTTPLRTTPEVTVITESRQPLSAIRLFDKENCVGTPRPNELFAERLDEEDGVQEPLKTLRGKIQDRLCELKTHRPSPFRLFQWTDPSTAVDMLRPMTSVSSTA